MTASPMNAPLHSAAPCGPRCACARSARRASIYRFAAGAIVLGSFPLAHAFTPMLLRDAIPLCLFRIATGKPCPLCGLTRAIAQATHGRWHSAFALNPLWPIFAALMILLGLLLLADAFTGRRWADRVSHAVIARSGWIIAALCAFDAVRIAYGSNVGAGS